MTLRLFHCKDCGHHMRFAGNHCGRCYAKKEPSQMPGLWYTIILVFVVLLLTVGVRALAAGL